MSWQNTKPLSLWKYWWNVLFLVQIDDTFTPCSSKLCLFSLDDRISETFFDRPKSHAKSFKSHWSNHLRTESLCISNYASLMSLCFSTSHRSSRGGSCLKTVHGTSSGWGIDLMADNRLGDFILLLFFLLNRCFH